MNDLSEIKPDVCTEMTETMHRLFIANGCDPTCHCCNEKISVGSSYKLGHVKKRLAKRAARLEGFTLFKSECEHDVMLCAKEKCTPENMYLNKVQRLKEYKSKGLTPYGREPKISGGCSIINGEIVP